MFYRLFFPENEKCVALVAFLPPPPLPKSSSKTQGDQEPKQCVDNESEAEL